MSIPMFQSSHRAIFGIPGHKAGALGVVAQRHDALDAAAAAEVQERSHGLGSAGAGGASGKWWKMWGKWTLFME